MGYESKIIIGKRKELPNGYVWFDDVAQFDLSKMGYEYVENRTFHETFRTPIDFNIYLNNYDPDKEYPDSFFREDMYGKQCKYTETENVLRWLEKSETAKEYWRAELLLMFLRELKEKEPEWGTFCAVHYGY